MKKVDRWPYLALTYVEYSNGGNSNLCSFCRFAKWEGDCGEAYCACSHPLYNQGLWRVADVLLEGDGRGDDCWGFRPKIDVPGADGMVANWLAGKDVVLLKGEEWSR